MSYMIHNAVDLCHGGPRPPTRCHSGSLVRSPTTHAQERCTSLPPLPCMHARKSNHPGGQPRRTARTHTYVRSVKHWVRLKTRNLKMILRTPERSGKVLLLMLCCGSGRGVYGSDPQLRKDFENVYLGVPARVGRVHKVSRERVQICGVSLRYDSIRTI